MEKKRLNNEGFSLIELIIVIAIMAILVGALAPQLIKYIERSRQATDIQAIGSLFTAVQTSAADPVSNPNNSDVSGSISAGGGDYSGCAPAEVWTAVDKIVPHDSLKLTSDAYKESDISIATTNGNIIITVPAKSGSTGYDLTIDQNGSSVASPGTTAGGSTGAQSKTD